MTPLPRPLWPLRILCGVLATGALLIQLQILQGFPFRSVRALSAKNFKVREAGTWGINDRVLQQRLPGAAQSQVRLLENGQPWGPPLQSRGDLRRSSGAAWMVDQTIIRFRTADGSDPRSNGRAYQVVIPWTVPRPLAWATVPALLGSLIILFRLRTGQWVPLPPPVTGDRPVRNPAVRSAAEVVLLLLVTAVFLIPLILTVYRSSFAERFASHPWLANLTLPSPPPKGIPVPLSLENLESGRWQSVTSSTFNSNFAGREGMIRLLSEFWFRAFRSPAAQGSGIVIQPGDQLIESSYLEEYCLTRTTPDRLLPFVRDLRGFQDRCDQRGQPLVFVLTPSKAAAQPANIPPAWQARFRPGPRAIELLRPLLQQQGVRYIDGISLTANHSKAGPVPIFPQGGIHWSSDTAWQTTSAILAGLRHSWPDLPVPPPPALAVSFHPSGEDEDILALLTLAKPWSYPVAELTIPRLIPAPGSPPRTLAAVGGSFTIRILHQLGSTGLFRNADLFFYYQRKRLSFPDGKPMASLPVGPPSDVNREILQASAILLETNESVLTGDGPEHLREFLRSMASLPPTVP